MSTQLRPATGEPPTFELDADGRHVVWSHDCSVQWAPGEERQTYRAEPQPLPLDPVRGWTVVSTEPLTVTPSILCTGCGTHGFITAGRWVPA